MLVIGLTGGIGSGKSTVGALFASHGVPVIDTDEIARDVVRPGEPALEEIRQRLGAELIQPDGHLDRRALGRRVFSDAKLKQTLESIVHPPIRQELRERLSRLSAPYCIVAIPLLLEKGWQREVDRVLVVDAPEALRIQRTLTRPGMDAEQVRRIIDSQAGRDERLACADDIIVNDRGIDDLRAAVARLHRKYLDLAAT